MKKCPKVPTNSDEETFFYKKKKESGGLSLLNSIRNPYSYNKKQIFDKNIAQTIARALGLNEENILEKRDYRTEKTYYSFRND